MTWSDLPRNPTPKVLRQFAGAWLLFFTAWGLFQWIGKSRPQLGAALILIAVSIGVLGLIAPSSVRWIFVGWMVLGFPIGWVVSLTMLAAMYFLVLAPVAVVFRLLGRDAMTREIRPDASTYWSAKDAPEDKSRYFRQY